MKTVIVTGASRGIGAATAQLFIKKGCNVIVNYNTSRDAAEKLCSGHENAVAVQADVSDEMQVKALFRAAEDFGGADVLVNNAGIALRKMICDTSAEEWDRLFQVDVRSVFLCSREAAKSMVAKKSGRIINISSMWGVKGGSVEVAYSAAKAAVIGFTKAFARELGPSGITVNCIAPGVIDTEMNAALSADDRASLADETPLCRLGTAEEVAVAAAWLASDEASFVTAQVLGVDGGII